MSTNMIISWLTVKLKPVKRGMLIAPHKGVACGILKGHEYAATWKRKEWSCSESFEVFNIKKKVEMSICS